MLVESLTLHLPEQLSVRLECYAEVTDRSVEEAAMALLAMVLPGADPEEWPQLEVLPPTSPDGTGSHSDS